MLLSTRFGWLGVILAMTAISWVANWWAISGASRGLQYCGLLLYVVAEAVIFVPLLYLANLYAPQAIPAAGVLTVVVFGGLTGIVFVTKADLTSWGKYLWAGGLADNRIWVFDIATDPAKPKIVQTLSDLGEKSGWLGPHTYYAMPGRMLVQALSNTQDKGGRTGMALYNNKGKFIASYAVPTEGGGDGYGYDLAVNPRKNLLLTSSFTGYANYMRPIGELMGDAEAMKKFGATMVAWDLKAMKPTKVFSVPGAPLEIRWSLNPKDNWAITAAALTSKLWLVKQEGKQWVAKEVGTIGDPAKIPLPVDISITRDGKGLWVNTFMDGTTRYFDLSNPEAPKQTYEKVTGKQINMISQSWDGKRLYITSSLLANCDKGGADNEQFLRGFAWNGKELAQKFEVDFTKEQLGRAHHMKLGARGLAGK